MKNKSAKDALIGLVLGAAIMLGAVYLTPKELIMKVFPDSPDETVLFYTSVLVCPFVAIFIHELGHLLAGLIQGFKLQLFVVAFFGMKRVDNRLRFFFNREFQYFGGVAATSPKFISGDLRRAFAFVLIAGPLFSFLFGVLFISLFIFTNTLFNASFAIIGIVSIGLFIATTVPEKSGIFFTDRKRMQRLLDKGRTGEIEACFLKTTSQLLIDNHYRNISMEDLKIIQSDEEPMVQFWGHYYEYKHFEERGNEEKISSIKKILNQYKEAIPPTIWKSLALF